jgi:hypothetical protein
VRCVAKVQRDPHYDAWAAMRSGRTTIVVLEPRTGAQSTRSDASAACPIVGIRNLMGMAPELTFGAIPRTRHGSHQ